MFLQHQFDLFIIESLDHLHKICWVITDCSSYAYCYICMGSIGLLIYTVSF